MAWMSTLLLGLALLIGTDAEVLEEDGVLVLDEKNFEETIKSNPFILVEFYAPWCGHCKQFAPEYAAAAKTLKDSKIQAPLAKVDATSETKLAEEYGIRGYPTIRLFIDGRDQEYTGGRTQQSIVTWLTKKAGPAAELLEDVPAAEAFEKNSRLAVVGIFEESSSTDAFMTTARQLEDVMFAYSTAPKVVQRYELQPPALKMFFPHDEKTATFTGDMQNAKEMEIFVKAYRYPAVSIFDGETAPELFTDGRPIVFLFRDPGEKGDAAEKELREAAKSLQRRQLVAIAGSSEPMDQRLMDYVGVEPEELPTLRLVSNPMASMVKYKLPGELTAQSVTSFVSEFEAGKLRPHLKSENEPESQPGPVYTLVGSTFESIVKNSAKDVLVEFYAPWCGHCKKLEPIYKQVAQKLENVRSVVVAKIDATANDVEGVEVDGFPTIKFWRADKKDSPLDYDGDRDVDSFVAWLEEKAAVPFSREEVKTEL